jgi:hypothetical protein
LVRNFPFRDLFHRNFPSRDLVFATCPLRDLFFQAFSFRPVAKDPERQFFSMQWTQLLVGSSSCLCLGGYDAKLACSPYSE